MICCDILSDDCTPERIDYWKQYISFVWGADGDVDCCTVVRIHGFSFFVEHYFKNNCFFLPQDECNDAGRSRDPDPTAAGLDVEDDQASIIQMFLLHPNFECEFPSVGYFHTTRSQS